MDCHAALEGDLFTLENSRIQRVYQWNHGHLIGQRIVNKVAGRVWPQSPGSHAQVVPWERTGPTADFFLPGMTDPPSDGKLEVEDQSATATTPAHRRAIVTYRFGDLHVRRTFRLYPDCPAIACEHELRGRTDAQWLPPRHGDASLTPIEDFLSQGGEVVAPLIESFRIRGAHLRAKVVRFYDITDRRNTLAASSTFLPYRQPSFHAGNLLLAWDVFTGDGLFILKQAPCSDVQLAYPGFDYSCTNQRISVAGLGVRPEDLDERQWTAGYSVVTGLAGGGEKGLLRALRQYKHNVRRFDANRDCMILLNTWGDRSQDQRISESFALAELEAGKRLGITHFQLDAGWQTGNTSEALSGSMVGIEEHEQFWSPHPERFPNGLEPVVRRAKQLGIELALWFVPHAADSYTGWRLDADRLVALHKRYGIRVLKIDGVTIADHQAEVNFRGFLDHVQQATGGRAVFNLDTTAGQRFGYHYFDRYGNYFVENRYTDWGNYYPHWTLRNLWMLAHYVPPQMLHFEFLNRWRNPDRYPADDVLAPRGISFDYCFAVTMASQPLAWFEASNLPEEAFETARTIAAYRAHQAAIHSGAIYPIGDEPDGTRWTGFQSVNDPPAADGYFLVYRERNDAAEAALETWDLAGRRIAATSIAGDGDDFTANVAADGRVTFRLPGPFTFGLYRYGILDRE